MEVTFMSWYFRHLSALGLMLVSLPSTRPASAATAQAAQPESNLPFTVLVYNNAEVSPKMLAKTADLAKKIFRDAGLGMVWIEFVPQQPIGRQVLDQVDCVVRILSKARVVLRPGATGEALPCILGKVACFANVFFDRVKARAESGALSQAQVMAHAIAHELGHLLLGSDSHFGIGIMRAKWGPEEVRRMAKGDLLFRPEQAAIMKANLLDRLATKAQSLWP
jgi:hypothetical protein